MKLALFLGFAVLASGQTPPGALEAMAWEEAAGNAAADMNVNSRYTVESVGIANPRRYRISRSLIEDMHHLAGAYFNTELFESMAQRISGELHGHEVVFRLTRGADPAHVRVTFEVNGPSTAFDIEAPRLLYNSREGWSGEGDAVVNAGSNSFTFGVLKEGDSLLETEAGIRARYDRVGLFSHEDSDRVRLSFEFDSFHDSFDGATETAAARRGDLSALYRTRNSFEPSVTIAVAGRLTWTVGLTFQQMQAETPGASTETANAVVSALRYDKEWGDSTNGKHRFSALYSMHAATSFLGSAYAYTRHAIDASYHWKRGHQSAEACFTAGAILGRAPLYDRFVLGDSATLRGWDKFELDPLGGGRVVYGSAGYGYRMARVFYDTGAIWDYRVKPEPKQSAGVGVKVEGILLAVAFPLGNDRAQPVFIAGMNF